MSIATRFLVAKAGSYGNEGGAKVIARALRHASIEVIYAEARQTPGKTIMNAALRKDVQGIGSPILLDAQAAQA